jgi:hypothetical protein
MDIGYCVTYYENPNSDVFDLEIAANLKSTSKNCKFQFVSLTYFISPYFSNTTKETLMGSQSRPSEINRGSFCY